MLCQATSLHHQDHRGTRVKHWQVSRGACRQPSNPYPQGLVWARAGGETEPVGRKSVAMVTPGSRADPCPVAASHAAITPLILWEELRPLELLSLSAAVLLSSHRLERALCSPAALYALQDGIFHAQLHTGGSRNEYHLPSMVKRGGGGWGKPCQNHPPSRIRNSYAQPGITYLQYLLFPMSEEEHSENREN